MRDIKFRGKRVDNGDWVYGYYLAEKPPEGNIVHTIHTIEDCGGYTKSFSVTIGHRVDPDTVGQWTGQDDESGKDIYAGDRVWYEGKLWTVEPNEDYCGYAIVRSMNPDGENEQKWFMCDIACRCIVYSTIYDKITSNNL